MIIDAPISSMKIAVVEPFYGGSHKAWCDQLKNYSSHSITLFTLSAHHWKWRMQSGAITLAEKVNRHSDNFDLFLVSDFLNVPLFKSLLSPGKKAPLYLYFHENQLTYPWSPTDPDVQLKRDINYGFINYTSALTAEVVFFNSNYHLASFLQATKELLRKFPDHQNKNSVDQIEEKSVVLPLGLDLHFFDAHKPLEARLNTPTILWNHRWEFDKNPELFFNTLFSLSSKGLSFNLIVLGEEKNRSPVIFEETRRNLKNHIIHWGYCDDRIAYAQWLWQAHIIPVTSLQDFFGISTVEAIYCHTIPLLPNRLAYPEHIPFSTAYFYNNDHEFEEKLEHLIAHCNNINTDDLRNEVEKYDWSKKIDLYDKYFSY